MTIFYLLTFIICGSYTVLMIFYLIGWIKTPAQLATPHSEFRTKVSIVLPFRNEGKNISNILHSLLQQDYPKDKFEIIAVDDFSEDQTAELIHTANIFNLKLIRLSGSGGKKMAIAEGIKNASGNLIITTDADCQAGESWISSIVLFYEEYKPKMIVSPVLLKGENTVQEIIQSQEMSVLTAIGGASLHYNLPILCSGANLAYEKEAFNAVSGFEGVDKTATGDDVFLMLKLHNKFPNEIKYLKSKDAIVFTYPEKHSADALRQRKRWASKTFSYRVNYITWVAVLVFFTNFFILLSGILFVINVKFAFAFLPAILLKCIIDYMLLYSASSFFVKKSHPFIFVLGSIIYPLYVSTLGLISPFTNYSWKGRKS